MTRIFHFRKRRKILDRPISSRWIFSLRRLLTSLHRSFEFYETLHPIGSKLKGYLSATKATATGYVEANIYEALDPITVGQKNTMNLKRGPANCTTETFTRVQREHENPLFLVRLRRVQRERTRGLNEASIIIGHARSDEEREPLLSCPFDCDHGTITGW